MNKSWDNCHSNCPTLISRIEESFNFQNDKFQINIVQRFTLLSYRYTVTNIEFASKIASNDLWAWAIMTPVVSLSVGVQYTELHFNWEKCELELRQLKRSFEQYFIIGRECRHITIKSPLLIMVIHWEFTVLCVKSTNRSSKHLIRIEIALLY